MREDRTEHGRADRLGWVADGRPGNVIGAALWGGAYIHFRPSVSFSACLAISLLGQMSCSVPCSGLHNLSSTKMHAMSANPDIVKALSPACRRQSTRAAQPARNHQPQDLLPALDFFTYRLLLPVHLAVLLPTSPACNLPISSTPPPPCLNDPRLETAPDLAAPTATTPSVPAALCPRLRRGMRLARSSGDCRHA